MSKTHLFKSIAIILCAVLCINLTEPIARAETIPEPTAAAEETENSFENGEENTDPDVPESLLPILNEPTGEAREATPCNAKSI